MHGGGLGWENKTVAQGVDVSADLPIVSAAGVVGLALGKVVFHDMYFRIKNIRKIIVRV